MKNLKTILWKDTLLWSGMLSILISAAVFMVGSYLGKEENTFFSFVVNYGFTVCYTIAVFSVTLSKHRWSLSKGDIRYTAIMVILWFISAFSLNMQMNIFDNSTNWLSIYICVICVGIMAALVPRLWPLYIKHIISFILGASFLVLSYYAIYLAPMYAIGALAMVFIGLSLHLFAPLYLVIVTTIIAFRSIKLTPVLKYSFIAGILLPLFIVIGFSSQWGLLDEKIKRIQNQNTLHESKLPEWVVIAQQIPQSVITEKFLKAGLVYTTPKENSSWFWGDFGGSNFSEPGKHDPLVMTASLLTGRSGLGDEDKIKILKSVYDSRHLAQERLWFGDDLETANVVSNVIVYPEYRMAYTEKTLSIKNNSPRKWNSDQEAIYTFHLPEGAVISSLSLWIDGVEEKARLTTKGKADSAYTTIVGRERRDPSVVHWQEGNTVSVRIFPCNQRENRKFKIGITSPLKKEGKELFYENTYFDGPSPRNAIETVQLKFSGAAKQIESDLNPQDNGTYTDERTYQDKWTLSCAATPLSTQTFSFAGFGYKLKDAAIVNKPFSPTAIYLDINSSWSKAELDQLWPNIKDSKVYVYDEHLISLNPKNLEESYEHLSKKNFSLFPFYKITDPANALVITKNSGISPNLSDLAGSVFQKKTVDYLATAVPFQLYNIDSTISPYLKTLKEFGVFKYSEGDVNQLIQQLHHHQFKTLQEQENALNIPNAAMNIEKTTDSTLNNKTNVPDHLLRLFAYNRILKNVGASYFEKDYVQADLLATAEQAFIVSPVSSMIVLETQKDYDRFGIDESKNSLQNASIKSSGAAPEPQEWMLIFLAATVILYFMYKSGQFNRFKLTWRY